MERLLFCTSSLAWGGAERHTIVLLNRLAAQGHACELVTVKDDAAQLGRIAPALRGAMHCLHARAGLDRHAVAAYAAVVARFEPTVIVAANPYPLLYSTLARGLAWRPARLVLTFHSTRPQGAKETLQLLAYRPLFWAADCTVFVCERQRRYWLRRAALSRRNEVIHNGVDLREFGDPDGGPEPAALRHTLGLHASDYVIGISAALRPEKNHLQLVDAVSRLRRRGIAARALLIGDGPMRDAILAEAQRLRVGGDIVVTGFQADVRPYVRACDTMVLCSRSEALSLAAIEAMALRRPVVLSDVGGARELVAHGHDGFLFAPGDTDALVAWLVLLRDRALAARVGAAARRRVEDHFSEDVMVARYARLLRSLGQRPARPAQVLQSGQGRGHGR